MSYLFKITFKDSKFSKFISKLLAYLLLIISKIQTQFSKKGVNFLLDIRKSLIRDEFSYNFSKDIVEYAIKNEQKVEELKKNLDKQSIEVVNMVLDRCRYIYTHNLLEWNKLTSSGESKKFKEVYNYIRKFKKKTKLHQIDPVIFYYRKGLKYVPKKIIINLKNKDFIDGGAYRGEVALMFERLYQPKKIYCFEPEFKNYYQLLKFIEIHNLKEVIPIRMGLGEEEKIMKLKVERDASYISEEGEQQIKIITLDDFINENNLSVGLIKLDIEGYGLKAIKGAKKTIKQFKPVLLISIYHRGKEFFEIKSYIQKLNPNYKCII